MSALTAGVGGARHEHKDEVAEPHNLANDAEAKEKVSPSQANAEAGDKKNRERRARKNQSNGSKSEEDGVNQINIPIDDETNISLEMDKISDSVDHNVVLGRSHSR